MNNPEPNNSNSNAPESTDPEAENPDTEKMKSSTNTSLLMPVALLLVLLLIPFSINSFIHFLSSSNQFVHPVIMKIPIDSSAVTAPVEATQYEGFEVKLNVNTQQLSEFINEIVSIASVGTSIQGITGFISPNMQAEITGEGFRIENPGPQQQMYILGNTTEWKWHVVPKSSGIQTIKFKMHVTSTESTELDHQKVDVIELAQANISIDSNPTMWMAHNWWIFALLALALFGGWKVLRRYNDN